MSSERSEQRAKRVIKICCCWLAVHLTPQFIVKCRRRFDAIIVLISLIELVVGGEGGGGLAALRACRILRLFKLLRR